MDRGPEKWVERTETVTTVRFFFSLFHYFYYGLLRVKGRLNIFLLNI